MRVKIGLMVSNDGPGLYAPLISTYFKYIKSDSKKTVFIQLCSK